MVPLKYLLLQNPQIINNNKILMMSNAVIKGKVYYKISFSILQLQ